VGQPAAKQGDQITGTDTHMVFDSASGVSAPSTFPFAGALTGELSPDVKITGLPAAVVGSTADNFPKHVLTIVTASFPNAPSNKGTIQSGSTTVRINGKFAARHGDTAVTCNDPVDLPVGSVEVKPGCTVNIG
jgi:uncharacterized Zn-binding protein involved in type VI secretion